MTKLEQARADFIKIGNKCDQAWDKYIQARDKYKQAWGEYKQAWDKLLKLEIEHILDTKISISA